MLLLLIFLALSWQSIHCVEFWGPDFPEIGNILLEKGKPIKVPKYYEQVQLCKLNGTVYSDTLSDFYNVTDLRICHSYIDKIEAGALCSSKSVKTLELDFFDSPEVPFLEKEIFENCDNIEELLLKFNFEKHSSVKLGADIFEYLPNLKDLHIFGCKLDHLQKNVLKLSRSLTTLAFSSCDIREIDEDTFEDLSNLENLVLLYNRNWNKVPLKLFSHNSKLKELVLIGNGIKRLTWDEFEGLKELEKLHLTENRIEFFDADKIAKNLPHLKELFIDRNPLACKEKESFVIKLKEKLKEVEVVYKFDPGYYDSCEELD